MRGGAPALESFCSDIAVAAPSTTQWQTLPALVAPHPDASVSAAKFPFGFRVSAGHAVMADDALRLLNTSFLIMLSTHQGADKACHVDERTKPHYFPFPSVRKCTFFLKNEENVFSEKKCCTMRLLTYCRTRG